MGSKGAAKPALLVTVRDGGPATMIAALLSELRQTFATTILCDRSCRTRLSEGCDFEWIESGPEPSAACATAVMRVRPDIVLRTTPAYGMGIDEAIGHEVAAAVPVYCLQDHYGLGRGLGEVTRMGVMDDLARDCMPEALVPRIDVLGWLSHERFMGGASWPSARATGRAKLGLRRGEFAICYVCINSADPLSGREDIAAFLSAAGEIGDGARWCVRPHPAMSADDATWCARALAESGLNTVDAGPLGSEREWLSAFDLLVSPASVMLIDALAFCLADCDGRNEPPIDLTCLYLTTPPSCAAMRAASGLDRFPTHYPGRGFALAGRDDLSQTIAAALTDEAARARRINDAARYFRPAPGVASRICTWLEGGLSH